MARWQKSELEDLARLYATMPNAELMERFHRSKGSILWKAAELGLAKSPEHRIAQNAHNAALGGHLTGRRNGGTARNPFNEHYFDHIDTPEKAYWLGLIQADGSLIRRPDRAVVARFALRLQIKDLALIEQFIRDVEASPALLVVRHIGHGGHAEIRLSSPTFSESLQAAGVLPGKTLSGTYPPIPQGPLASHYVRGLFDGDGSIHLSRDQLIFEIIGPEGCCRDLLTVIRERVPTAHGNVYPVRSGLFTVTFQGTRQSQAIGDWLYHGATRYLERKRAVFAAHPSRA